MFSAVKSGLSGASLEDIQVRQTVHSANAVEWLTQVLAATAFWVIGRRLTGRMVHLTGSAIGRDPVAPTLTPYLGSVIAIARSIAMMRALRPIEVGDFVNLAGGVGTVLTVRRVGTVREQGLFGTAIVTPDKVMTLVGNGNICCHTDPYWQVCFDPNEAILRVCKDAGWPAPSVLHPIHPV